MSSDRSVVIVGAGMAGLACATALGGECGHVLLLDKGRVAGGRMSTKRIDTALGTAEFDYGAQYFTARDDGFRAVVARWVRAGVAAAWPSAGNDAFVGVPGMSEPIRVLAAPLHVEWSTTVTGVERRGDVWDITCQDKTKRCASTLVVALPAEQAQTLVSQASPEFAAVAGGVRTLPCWTVLVAFDRRLPAAADCLRDHPVLGWAARNSAKPGRTGPESWVLQASPDWSATHLEDDPADVVAALLRALADGLGAPLPSPIAATAHRWRYARSGSYGMPALWDDTLQLGVCGDWLIGPRVEAAWLSGTGLALAMLGGRAPPVSA